MQEFLAESAKITENNILWATWCFCVANLYYTVLDMILQRIALFMTEIRNPRCIEIVTGNPEIHTMQSKQMYSLYDRDSGNGMTHNNNYFPAICIGYRKWNKCRYLQYSRSVADVVEI